MDRVQYRNITCANKGSSVNSANRMGSGFMAHFVINLLVQLRIVC